MQGGFPIFAQNISMHDLNDFLEPINRSLIHEDEGFTDGQLGNHILINEGTIPDLKDVDIVCVGVLENRGEGLLQPVSLAADHIRKQLYSLYHWHTDISMADLGNVKTGSNLRDSYAAIKTVLIELFAQNKTVVLLGGSHDITLAQYQAYIPQNKPIEVSCVDALIDLRTETPVPSKNFLMELLTSDPNLVKHYNHLGFQSYLVHPRMLETIDKLRFDCYRSGHVSENIEDMEPVFRNSHMLSFDINAIKNSDAPSNRKLPNGLTGIEACMLTRYAGMSDVLNSIGFYGYNPNYDPDELTAAQIAQMIWYFIDGKSRSKQEKSIDDRQYFNEFHTAFAEIETLFLQSKRTSRWWMQMPDKSFVPCSYADFKKACNNEIPERWLRVQERD